MKYKEVPEMERGGCVRCINHGNNEGAIDCVIFRKKNNLRPCGVNHIIFVEDKEEEYSMNSLEKNVREAKELIEKALRKLEHSKKVISYPVLGSTPVNGVGNILFNNNKQVLLTNRGSWDVYSYKEGYNSRHKDFMWVPIKREDLKTGDTAYRSEYEIPAFSDHYEICKILDTSSCVFATNYSVSTGTASWSYWFKLVNKEEL